MAELPNPHDPSHGWTLMGRPVVILDPAALPIGDSSPKWLRTLANLARDKSPTGRNQGADVLDHIADLIEAQTAPPVKVPSNQRAAMLIRFHLASQSIDLNDRAELEAFAGYLTDNAVCENPEADQ